MKLSLYCKLADYARKGKNIARDFRLTKKEERVALRELRKLNGERVKIEV